MPADGRSIGREIAYDRLRLRSLGAEGVSAASTCHFRYWRVVIYGLETGKSMNFIIWLVVGGLIGWIASMIMRTDAQQGVILNVVVGIIGAMLGGWLLAPLFGTGTINQNDFSLAGLGVSLLGAIILLAIVNLIRRGTPR